ncbi:MAG: hypothetical protein H7145_20035 [Akkermansiaceae bacterium]|nr:hypothetical protein [Armatimonadota bacterium]
MDKNIEIIKKLYLVPNEFQLWAWILTTLAILFCFKGTRRFGGMWFLVILVCMGLYFGLTRAMKDFAPKEIPKQETKQQTGRRRLH